MYKNYAAAEQNPFMGYGAANLDFLKEVQKYDPEGIFTRLVPGGFKIPSLRETV